MLTRSLAIMQFKMALANFIWHFDARLKEANQQEPKGEDAVIFRKGPFEIVISAADRDGLKKESK
jgi:hypothetical protein